MLNSSQACAEYNIKFIGASPEMINSMGDKATAKATMKAAGVPCIPGSDGLLESIPEGIKLAKEKWATPLFSRQQQVVVERACAL